MRPDSHTQLPYKCLCPLWFFLFLCFLGDIAFSEYFVFCNIAVSSFVLYGEYLVTLYVFLPDTVVFKENLKVFNMLNLLSIHPVRKKKTNITV